MTADNRWFLRELVQQSAWLYWAIQGVVWSGDQTIPARWRVAYSVLGLVSIVFFCVPMIPSEAEHQRRIVEGRER